MTTEVVEGDDVPRRPAHGENDEHCGEDAESAGFGGDGWSVWRGSLAVMVLTPYLLDLPVDDHKHAGIANHHQHEWQEEAKDSAEDVVTQAEFMYGRREVEEDFGVVPGELDERDKEGEQPHRGN